MTELPSPAQPGPTPAAPEHEQGAGGWSAAEAGNGLQAGDWCREASRLGKTDQAECRRGGIGPMDFEEMVSFPALVEWWHEACF